MRHNNLVQLISGWNEWLDLVLAEVMRVKGDELESKKGNLAALIPAVMFQSKAIAQVINQDYAAAACSALRTYHEHVALLTALCLTDFDDDIHQSFSNSKDVASANEFYSKHLYGKKLPNKLQLEHDRKFSDQQKLHFPKAPDYIKIFQDYKNAFNTYTHPTIKSCIDISLSMESVISLEESSKQSGQPHQAELDNIRFMKRRGIENEISIIKAFLSIPNSYYETIFATLSQEKKLRAQFLYLRSNTLTYQQTELVVPE